MSTRVDPVNRVVLALVGLLLLAAGAFGLAVGFDAFGTAESAVLPAQVRQFPRQQPWFWWAVAAACLVIALLALRWLVAQLRTDRVGRLDLTTDDRDGQTVVHAGALTDAVEGEAEALRGVSAASAHLTDVRGRQLSLTVDLADYADIAQVRQGLEEHVVAHARQAVDDPALPVEIELRPGARTTTGRGLR